MNDEPEIEHSATRPGWSDTHVETLMGRLLQVGVVFAATVVLIGGILFLVCHGAEHVDLSQFHEEPAEFRSPSGVIQAATSLSARGIIQLGMLLLVATPIARVVFSVYAFLRLQKDRMYVAFTLIVLSILLFSLVWGDF